MPSTATLPRWANDIIDATPKRGGGLNRWLLRPAIALRACGRSEQEIIAELRVLTAGEPIKPGEIERAAKRSADYMDGNGTAHHPAPKWPRVDKAARATVIAGHAGMRWSCGSNRRIGPMTTARSRKRSSTRSFRATR